MFRKKRNRDSYTTAAQVSDKAAGKIVLFINRMQIGFAATMNKRTRHYSAKTWMILIVVLALLWGGMSFHFISTAFTNHPQPPKGLTIDRNNYQMFMTRSLNSDSLRLMEMIYEKQKAEQRQTLKDK
jgi:hypothetical protein